MNGGARKATTSRDRENCSPGLRYNANTFEGCGVVTREQNMNLALPRSRFWIFTVLVAAIYVVEFMLAARMMRLSRPGIAAGAILIDLAVFVPCLYYLFFLRARESLVGLTPVFLLSLAGAAVVLPAGYHGLIGLVRLLAVPAELVLIGLVALRVRRFWRDASLGGRPADVLETLTGACAEVVGKSRLADMLGY